MIDPNKTFNKAFKAAEEGNFVKAEQLYRRLTKVSNNYDSLNTIHYNYGLVLMSLKKYYEAIANFKKSNTYKHSDENDWCQSLCYLYLKQWDKGMKLFSSRYGKTRHSNTAVTFPDLPLEKITTIDGWEGKKLLVLNEQGLGDAILFNSQLFELNNDVEKAVVQVSADHIDLFNKIYNYKNIEFKVFDNISVEYLEEFDSWIPLGDVFSLSYMNNSPISNGSHYINSRTNINDIKIGVCWNTNKESPNSSKRSIEPSVFKDIKYELVSLQYGEGYGKELELDDYLPETTLETWNRLDDLSIVITVDTLVAHLAGKKGIPTILIINKHLDWRWTYRDEEDDRYSMFYPQVSIVDIKDDLNEIIESILEAWKE